MNEDSEEYEYDSDNDEDDGKILENEIIVLQTNLKKHKKNISYKEFRPSKRIINKKKKKNIIN